MCLCVRAFYPVRRFVPNSALFDHCFARSIDWWDLEWPAGEESRRGVVRGVPPLGEVDAPEDAGLARDAGIDLVVGEHHGVHLGMS